MSGPVAFVTLWEPLADPNHQVLRHLIESVEEGETGRPPSPLEQFWVADTRPIGGSYHGGRRPFGLQFGGEAPTWDDHHLDLLAKTFGYAPKEQLLVSAFCNHDEDHRILAEICLHLVKRLGGIIAFGGGIMPPIPPEAGIDLLSAPWSQCEPYFRQMVAGMPGRIVGLPFITGTGWDWIGHVGDAEFLRAWMEHPNFRMVD